MIRAAERVLWEKNFVALDPDAQAVQAGLTIRVPPRRVRILILSPFFFGVLRAWAGRIEHPGSVATRLLAGWVFFTPSPNPRAGDSSKARFIFSLFSGPRLGMQSKGPTGRPFMVGPFFVRVGWRSALDCLTFPPLLPVVARAAFAPAALPLYRALTLAISRLPRGTRAPSFVDPGAAREPPAYGFRPWD